MVRITRRPGVGAALGLALLAWTAAPVLAQQNAGGGNAGNQQIFFNPQLPRFFSMPPSNIYNPYSPTQTPYYTCYGYCPGGGQLYNNYGNYGGYPYDYGYDPYSGFLRGGAQVIQAQGQFAVSMEQSQLIRQQRKQAEIDTRRKLYEEWKYERNDQPTLEQLRRDAIEQAYKRAIFNPPLNDIWSADALNRILDHASRIMKPGGSPGPSPGLDDDTMQKINFTTGVAGNFGLLKDKGRLTWPVALMRPEFAAERDRISKLTEVAYQQADTNGRVGQGTLDQLNADYRVLRDKLVSRVEEIDTPDYLEARRYLNELNRALTILKRPDIGDIVAGKYRANGKDVAALIKDMSGKGLRFAPAQEGDEGAYSALYKAMAQFDMGLGQGGKE